MMLLGYAVSYTDEENYREQRTALEQAGCASIYDEGRVSRSTRHCPALQSALSRLQPGDTLLVSTTDRVARSLPELIEFLDGLNDRKAYFRSLAEGIDTASQNTPLSSDTLCLLARLHRSFKAPKTRSHVAQRAAKIGRKPALSPTDIAVAIRLLEQGETSTSVAYRLGIARCTLYRTLARQESCEHHLSKPLESIPR